MSCLSSCRWYCILASDGTRICFSWTYRVQCPVFLNRYPYGDAHEFIMYVFLIVKLLLVPMLILSYYSLCWLTYFLELLRKYPIFFFLLWLLFQALFLWRGLISSWVFLSPLRDLFSFQWYWQQWMLKWQSTLWTLISHSLTFFLYPQDRAHQVNEVFLCQLFLD